jgi:hypothetical protein
MVISRNNQVWCQDERRSGELRAPSHPLNGIDFVEFVRDPAAVPGRRFRLDTTFLKPPPAGLEAAPQAFAVIGGVRLVGIGVLDVEADPAEPLRLRVFLDQEGDFSTYVLRVEDPAIDPERSEARFGFKAGCPSQFDCRPRTDCPPGVSDEPALDYLAKDYQSLRRLMLDLIPERNPGWIERLPADLGMALVELFAYAGDYLSYYQDAAGTEAYLDSCLHRVSAARHARLVDYRMHQGRNAFTYVHFEADAGTDGVVPAGAKLLTRVGTPLRGQSGAPGLTLPLDADLDSDPALTAITLFETTAITRVTDRHNALRIHSWGDSECCLAAGAREAFLYGVPPMGANPSAFRPELQAGDYLLLEEVRSPVTGAEADADPRRRQVVRLVEVEDTDDPAYRRVLTGRRLTPRSSAGQQRLPLQRIVWREQDALGFALCLTAETPETGPIDPVSLVRGNLAPADHGRTLQRRSDVPVPGGEGRFEITLPTQGAGRWPLPWLSIGDAQLTHQSMPDTPLYAPDNRLLMGRHDLEHDAREAMPAIVLDLDFPGGERERWEPVPHLLDSGPYDQHFVAEVDDAGQTRLRFGDDQYGRRPAGVERVTARLRIGNGRAGNIGAGTLVHIVQPTAAELTDPANPAAGPAPFASLARIYQPLPARGGEDPETIEEVRQLAPEAFRAVQLRAVTETDWQEMALRHAGVAAAKARFRWTGSWHTVSLAIHPVDSENLVRLAGSAAALALSFAAQIRAHLTRFKLAGYDLVVRAAQYVPLEIDIHLCVARGHFRGDVLEAVAAALSNRAFADGSHGFFHPLAFSFGQAVYLSRLYAAVEAVAGVESAQITLFKRYWEPQRDELQRGRISVGDLEIARLDNDPSFPENGVLRLTAVGGL